MRIVVDPRLRIGNADLPQKLQRAFPDFSSRSAAVQRQHLADLPPDTVQRIERGHRILKDHRDAGALDLAQFVYAELHEVATVEADLSGEAEARILPREADDRA